MPERSESRGVWGDTPRKARLPPQLGSRALSVTEILRTPERSAPGSGGSLGGTPLPHPGNPDLHPQLGSRALSVTEILRTPERSESRGSGGYPPGKLDCLLSSVREHYQLRKYYERPSEASPGGIPPGKPDLRRIAFALGEQ